MQDELEADIRARWICPKVYAFSELYKKYKIRLGNDPVFSDYILNLYRIMENSNYSILENNTASPVSLSANGSILYTPS